MSASAYARLVPQAYRTGRLPKINRPMRPRAIAWAGPDAFYPNRFYERDKWYKARIDKPEKIPKLHIIDPAKFMQPLSELVQSPLDSTPVDIGFLPSSVEQPSEKPKEDLEKLARTRKLSIDVASIHHNRTRIVRHYGVFEDLFGWNVIFNDVQDLDIVFGETPVYVGNVISPSTASSAPHVKVASIGGGGLTTLLMVSLDGSPDEGERNHLLHWLVADIPDGKEVADGKTVVPYLQPLPFYGTGLHRVTFVTFRHQKPLHFDLSSDSLGDRLFDTADFYKSRETDLTPSSLRFFQTKWDVSVRDKLHEFGLESPVYKYEYREALRPPQREFPHKPMPFDLYLDQFRDPKEVDAEILRQRLQRAKLGEGRAPKYPDVNYAENKKTLPAWIHARIYARDGRFAGLYRNALETAQE